ncbi:MAG: hypothetical protein NTU58_03315 [Candidatus Nealsonbacteria bacterium]|nr:hypothetical protein [Candidatus Nealsonbacteria bacterium]
MAERIIEIKKEDFLIAGTVNGTKQAFEIQEIAKTSVIARRSRYLGNLACEETESLKEKNRKQEETFKAIDEFLANIANENREKATRTFIENIRNAGSFLKKILYFGKTAKPE